MKYLDEYRDPAAAETLAAAIARTVTRPWTVMEVCGGQTHTIVRYGIDELLPPGIELVHGPGCTVCVTPLELVDKAVTIASRPDVIRRAAIGGELPVMVVQLVGHDPRLVAQAARLSASAGAQIVDLNFGCPAKAVTGQACGSALMREPDRIEAIVAAACEAVDVPVTVIASISEPVKPCSACRSRTALTAACAVAWHG